METTTEEITWHPANNPPDPEVTVLLSLADGQTWPGFWDGGILGYRNPDSLPYKAGHILGWAEMPLGIKATQPKQQTKSDPAPEWINQALNEGDGIYRA